MSEIRVLPQHLANQIAAGEVVERPASVIKELLENSLDAGAKKISIETELGGRRLMKISDDGIGISSRESELAFKRHATSKLNDLNDLESIETLGFRGEALASIAAVSKTEMLTKSETEELAVRVLATPGEVRTETAARPTGTTITVKDLFFNTPARRKFLRSQPTENYHITAIVTHYALANPEIAFSLKNNGRETLRLAPARSLKERAYQIFGGEMIESLVPVDSGPESFLRVHGFVSAPRERRTSRDSQYFFINGRFVKDKVISKGLTEGYRSVLPHGVYPVAFLFLELPPEEVDVNVHPSKTEVRFRRAEAVKEVIGSAVRQALSNSGIGIREPIRSDPSELSGQDSQKLPDQPTLTRSATASSYMPGNATESIPPEQSLTPGAFKPDSLTPDENFEDSDTEPLTPPSGYGVLPPVDSAYSVPEDVSPADLDLQKIRAVGQLHNSFIIAADDEGLLLIDQHVAHERILFDYFKRLEQEREIESQNLLIPETIDLTPAQAEVYNLLEEELEAYGFSVSEMSGRTVAIKAVPSDLPAGEASNLLSEILETIDPTKRGDAQQSIKDDIAATLACKAAVKINMQLTMEKMEWMIENLLVTDSPSTCPHGRPVVLRLTMKDIERKFHRT
ncbi:MAG: DNA mismatch repair endonuclease MutL [Pyrinomonadaceae bacterium]|nr:DNA mismatch repair endonuclease MutL [Pyrinomonadaceae bacterium]